MEKVWITFLVVMLLITTVVWGGYSFYLSSTDIDVNPQAVIKSNKIEDSFDIETLLVIEQAINEQNVDTSKYHELDVDGNLYEDFAPDVIEPSINN